MSGAEIIPDDTAAGQIRGIALICVAVALFSCLDATAKYLSADLPTLQIVWARFFVHAVIAALLLGLVSGRAVFSTRRPGLQIFRAMLLFATTMFNFLALRHLGLSITVSIMFLSPLLVAALSVPLLGEEVGRRRWTAIIVGFLGVLLVTRPGLGGLHWAVAYSFGAAVTFALYSIATRMIARVDSAPTTFVYTPVVGALLLAPAMPVVWTTPASPLEWALLSVTGLLGGIGHFLMIVAHRHATAAALAPFTYTQIVSMVFLGYVVFGEVPVATTLGGAAIVIASGLYVLYRERAVRRGRKPDADGE